MKLLKPLLAIMVLALWLNSCTKVETKPQQPTIDTSLTKEMLVGKWDVYYSQFAEIRPDGSIKWSDEWKRDTGYFHNEVGPLYRFWNDATDVSYMTFSENGRFTHNTPDGELGSYMLRQIIVATGEWQLHPQSLTLTTFPDSGKLDYFCHYKEGLLGLEYGVWETHTGDSLYARIQMILLKL